VLALEGDACGILSLLGTQVDANSAVGVMRKQYLLLSTKIHPDKHVGKNQHLATRAFQVLVSAYDGLSQPDMSKTDTAKPKTKTINRSNEGCYKTPVHCPRCSSPWGEGVDGLEPAAYSHMMTGIKTYCCSTCLLDFGCMTAMHKCPFCKKSYEYTPDDYHQKIGCGNKTCTRTFGFMLYNVSEARMKELRVELKSEQERRLKKMEGLARRNARAVEKNGGSNVDSDAALGEEVKTFKAGLLDACPQCGFKMGKRDGEDEAVAHLKQCSDTKKIQAHQRRKRIDAEAAAVKTQKCAAQDQVTNMSSWEFLGGENENMWMLSEEALKKLCLQYKIDESGDKDELIARLVRHRNSLDSSHLLTDDSAGAGQSGKGASIPTNLTLPSNLEAMSVSQLKSVAASHGIIVKGSSKDDIIQTLELHRFRDQPKLRLTRTAENEEDEPLAAKKRAGAGGSKRKKGQTLDSDSDDEVSLLDLQKKGKKGKKSKAQADDDDDDDDFIPDA